MTGFKCLKYKGFDWVDGCKPSGGGNYNREVLHVTDLGRGVLRGYKLLVNSGLYGEEMYLNLIRKAHFIM